MDEFLASQRAIRTLVEAGDPESVKDVLSKEPSRAASAAHYAVACGDLSLATYILDEYEPTIQHDTAASALRSPKLVELILNHGWDINAPCIGEQPMLSIAIRDDTMVDFLLAHQADPNYAHSTDDTPLSYAVSMGNKAVVEKLFERGGDAKRGQLMHRAVENRCDLDMLEFLQERGAPVDNIEYDDHPRSLIFRDGFPRSTPLHLASKSGNLVALRFLLQSGADIKKRDTRGRNALEIAQTYRQVESFKLLKADR